MPAEAAVNPKLFLWLENPQAPGYAPGMAIHLVRHARAGITRTYLEGFDEALIAVRVDLQGAVLQPDGSSGRPARWRLHLSVEGAEALSQDLARAVDDLRQRVETGGH